MSTSANDCEWLYSAPTRSGAYWFQPRSSRGLPLLAMLNESLVWKKKAAVAKSEWKCTLIDNSCRVLLEAGDVPKGGRWCAGRFPADPFVDWEARGDGSP